MNQISNNQILNTNITNNFSISFVKHPTLNYNVVNVRQPGISIESTKVYKQTKFSPQPNRSQDPVRESCEITFNVSELYENYFEIFDWIQSYIKRRDIDINDIVSDILIIQYDLNKNPTRNISLVKAFPVSITGVDLTTNTSTAEPLKFSSTFEMTEIDISSIK